jgi:xylulokinase
VPLVAGVDCSTQSTKVLVVDPEDGRVVAAGAASHPVEGTSGARETDPGEWEVSLADALEATGRAEDVVAVSVGAQQHGLVVLDAGGRPLRKAPLWNDTRGATDAARLVEAFGGPGECANRVGSVITSSFTVAHWAWLRRTEPEVAATARHVMLPHDYLTYRLGGGFFTDRSDASGTGWWSPSSESYDAGVLALPAVNLPEELLPEVLGPEGSAGEVTQAASARFGLRAGTLIACGAGDNASAALALSFQPGEAAVSLGTSGTVYAPADAPSADPTGVVSGFASADGRYLPLACTLNATVAIDLVASWLGLDREDVAPAGEVVFLPWFGGERTPNAPGASGTVFGLRYETDKRSVLQAAYDGLVATLLEATGSLDRWAPQAMEAPLLLIGGGARGRAWQETVRRLSGRPVVVIDAAELVAYGAAVQAAAIYACQPVREVAARWGVREGTLLPPVERDQAALDRVAVWRETVLPLFGRAKLSA